MVDLRRIVSVVTIPVDPANASQYNLPVDVSLTQRATLCNISVRTFLLATAAAKNSQSLLVYKCRLSSGKPYRCKTL